VAIEVGDAVLTFLGDTTQLDAAFDRVGAEAPAKLEPASQAIKEVGTNWQFAGETASTAGEQAIVAGEEMEEAGDKAAFSMREAKGEIALLGEEIGIKVPRHVRGFLAELPGVGTALEAAFSATAALILIQVLVEGTKKLSEFIGEHFIFTEAMKEEVKVITETNLKLVELAKTTEELKKQYEQFGETGTKKIKAEFDDINKKFAENHILLEAGINLQQAHARGWEVDAEAMKKANENLVLYKKTEENLLEQMGLKEKQYDQVLAEELAARDKARVAAAETRGAALLAIQEANAKLHIASIRINYEQEAAIDTEFADKKYQLDLRTLEQRRAILARDPEKNANELIAINAQIDALEENHHAQQIQRYAAFLALKAQMAHTQAQTEASTFGDTIGAEGAAQEAAFKTLDDLDKAFNEVGIEGSTQLFESLERAQKGYETLRNSGVAAAGDLIQAQMNLLRVQIEYDQQFGGDTTKERRQLQQLGDEYDKLTGHVDKSITRINQMMALYVKDVQQAGNQTKFFSDVGKFAIEDFAKSAGNAFDSFLQHQAGFGEAMKQATASTLDSIASMAFANAIFYTAQGIADVFWNPERAGADFAAAAEFAAVAALAGAGGYALGGGKKDSGGIKEEPQGPATQGSSSQGAGTTTNQRVSSFASGGLVTGRTLAILGDSTKDSGDQTEVALPLDDPEAVAKIRAALGGSGGDTHIYHISGMISADSMKKTMQRINSLTKRNQGRLTSNNSYKVTKRG
jgi:hypothetical protein